MTGWITTPRLKLIPLSLEVAKAIVFDRAIAANLLSIRLPDDWPSEAVENFLPFYIDQLEVDASGLDWGIWLILHVSQQVLIGNFGFSGKPNATGTVEIGYEILPNYQRQGYGWEASQAMISWGFSHVELKRIFAQCDTSNLASIHLLEKLGMQRLWLQGTTWQWQLKRQT